MSGVIITEEMLAWLEPWCSQLAYIIIAFIWVSFSPVHTHIMLEFYLANEKQADLIAWLASYLHQIVVYNIFHIDEELEQALSRSGC